MFYEYSYELIQLFIHFYTCISIIFQLMIYSVFCKIYVSYTFDKLLPNIFKYFKRTYYFMHRDIHRVQQNNSLIWYLTFMRDSSFICKECKYIYIYMGWLLNICTIWIIKSWKYVSGCSGVIIWLYVFYVNNGSIKQPVKNNHTLKKKWLWIIYKIPHSPTTNILK